jgi:hypothetical protein
MYMTSLYGLVHKQVGSGYCEEDKVLLRIMNDDDRLTVHGIEFTAACVNQVQRTKKKYLGELDSRLYVEQGDILKTEDLPQDTSALSCSFCEYYVVSIAVLILASRCQTLHVMLMDEEVYKYLQMAFTYAVRTKAQNAHCNKAIVAKFYSYTLDDEVLADSNNLEQRKSALRRVVDNKHLAEVKEEHERHHMVVNMDSLRLLGNSAVLFSENIDDCSEELKRDALGLQKATKPLTLVLLILADSLSYDTACRVGLTKRQVNEKTKTWQFTMSKAEVDKRKDSFTSKLFTTAVQVEITATMRVEKAEQQAEVCSICFDVLLYCVMCNISSMFVCFCLTQL